MATNKMDRHKHYIKLLHYREGHKTKNISENSRLVGV